MDEYDEIRELKKWQAKFDKMESFKIKPKEEDLKFDC